MEVSAIGLDLAKNVFQAHGVDRNGNVTVCKTLRPQKVVPFYSRLLPCVVGLEACRTSHNWARETAWGKC